MYEPVETRGFAEPLFWFQNVLMQDSIYHMTYILSIKSFAHLGDMEGMCNIGK